MAEVHYNDYNLNNNISSSELMKNEYIPSEDYYCEVPGVYYHFSKAEWRLVYRDPQCRHRRLQKTFSTKKYGFYGAREKAIAFKNFIDIQTLSEQSVQPAIRSYVRKKGTERKMRLRKASLCLAIINKNTKNVSIPIASAINKPSCFSLIDQSDPNFDTALNINNPIYSNQMHAPFDPKMEQTQLQSEPFIEKIEPPIMKREYQSNMNFISQIGPYSYFENHYHYLEQQFSYNHVNQKDFDINYLKPHHIRYSDRQFTQPQLDPAFNRLTSQRFPFYSSQFDERFTTEGPNDITKNIFIPDMNLSINDNVMGENKELVRYLTYQSRPTTDPLLVCYPDN